MALLTPNVAIAEPVSEEVEYTEVVEIPESVEGKIEYYSEIYQADTELMKRIAWAESRYQNVWNFMHDVNPNYYTAFGIFQITRGTYKSFCGDPSERFDVDKNIECAMIIATTSGVHHWNESKGMW